MSRDQQRLLDQLDERLARLDRLIELGRGRLDDLTVNRAVQAEQQARTRLGHGTSHTVVALAGATGSGKSSLFNAIAGAELAVAGVTRPTTSTAQAVVFGDGADRLLDWLEVPRRHSLPNDEMAGLVLLDLPDHDSTAEAHRKEVDRLVQVVDVFLWVVDPQKYADAALHEGYLQRFASHSAVTLVALNQIDRLSLEERRLCIDHLGSLLAADGLVGVRVMPTSAVSGEGISSLRNELAARVAERRALIARLQADLDWVADDLLAACGDVTPGRVNDRLAEQVQRSFAEAAGVGAVADAVAAAHRYRATAALGWPPTRWVKRFRPDPLRRLGLDKLPLSTGGRSASKSPEAVDHSAPVVIPRTSRSGPSPVAEAAVSTAVQQLCHDATEGIPDPLRRRTIDAVQGRAANLPDALDAAVASTPLPSSPPRWWSLINSVQWLVAGVMAAGLLWLTVIFVLSWLGLPKLPTFMVTDAVSWPTALAVGGAAVGLLIALLGRLAASAGANRRARQARAALTDATSAVAQETIIGPMSAELATVAQLGDLARQFSR